MKNLNFLLAFLFRNKRINLYLFYKYENLSILYQLLVDFLLI